MLRVDVSKNSITAPSSNDGEFVTSTTTAVPLRTSATPSPVSVLTPVSGDAATASWRSRRRSRTTLEPMRPVPPMTTIFIGFSFRGDPRSGSRTPRSRRGHGNGIRVTPQSGPRGTSHTTSGAAQQGLGEFLAGADVELREHLPQVVLDGARADEQLRGDLRVALSVRGKP